MHDVNIGATIARKRHESGITQGELARHLGVTKAAVSKWELDQSLPDVALLPRIAAYFGISLDELFAFRPQLTEDEVRSIYLKLCRQFAGDADAAYARMDQLARDYASCWTLLLQLAALYTQRALVEPHRVDELLERSLELVKRVEVNTDDVEQVRAARLARALAVCQRGALDDAIALVESLKPARPLGIEATLAGLYQMKGQRDACLKLCQETLFWGELNVMQSITTQLSLYTDDPSHLALLLRAAKGVMEGFATESATPLEAATFYGCAATACLRAGDEEGSRAYLERLVSVLERHDEERLVFGTSPALFDLIPELVGTDPEVKEAAMDGLFGGFSMKEQCKLAVKGDEVWAAVADDARFKSLLDRLTAA